MNAIVPTPYGAKSYWDDRFAQDKTSDWLLPPDCLNSVVEDVIKQAPKQPRLLHIGCGLSELSFELRGLVTNPAQVTNLDYSRIAIERCMQREEQRIEKDPSRGKQKMEWRTNDLLSTDSVAALLTEDGTHEAEQFDIIVDKVTSDTIACADDAEIKLPFQIKPPVKPTGRVQLSIKEKLVVHIHPLYVLAVHLAALLKSRSGRWIVLSYSDDRFPFLSPTWTADESPDLDPEILPRVFPEPRKLWRLERKEPVFVKEKPKATNTAEGIAETWTETPYWLYVLARTNARL